MRGTPELKDGLRDTLLNPTVLIEVLSASTEAYDRGEKFTGYRKIPSLREYLPVAQHTSRIERYVRQGEAWVLTEAEGMEGCIAIENFSCVLALREVYDKVAMENGGEEWESKKTGQ